MAILIVGLALVVALLSLVEVRVYRLHIRQLADNYAHQLLYYNTVAIDSDGQFSFLSIVDDTRTYIQIGDQLVDMMQLDAWQNGSDVRVSVYDL